MPEEKEFVESEERAARILFRALNRLLKRAIANDDRFEVASAVINMMRLEEAYPHLKLTEMLLEETMN